jgi:hypothetical protein
MKFPKINILMGAVLALSFSSCEKEIDSESTVTQFPQYTAVPELATAPVVSECNAGVVTVRFTLNEKQINDVVLEVLAGESSIATEGVDFDLITHEIEIPAFAGQDTFSVDLEIYEDFEMESGAAEPIALTFRSVDPSGLVPSDIVVATIEDSGFDATPGETADFELNWEYADGLAGDPCNNDIDLTFQAADETDPYAAEDLLGYGAASTACPEVATLTIGDMNEGEVYNIWIVAWGDDAVARDLTISIDYTRESSTLDGTLTSAGVFDSAMSGDAAIIGTIEKNCNVVTIKDPDGNVVSEGRVSSSLKTVHVMKPSFKQ